MKKCTKYGISKETSEFHKRAISLDGLAHVCKACNKAWRVSKKEEIALYQRKYYSENKEQYALWRAAHVKETAAYDKAYAKANRGKRTANGAKYEAAKLQAVPPWQTEEQRRDIEATYVMAKYLQDLSREPLEVDHEIPLRGENVCGLHVPWNLLIIPKPVNAWKGNRFDPVEYNERYLPELKAIT